MYAPLTGGSADDKAIKTIVGEFTTRQPNQVMATAKMVHIDPSAGHAIEDNQKKKHKNKKQDRGLTAREKRQLNIYDIPREAQRYDLFVPLHNLWQGYMTELYTQGPDVQNFARKLLKADFHGAILTVTRSKNPLLVGLQGIVVQETLNVFKIITKHNRLLHIPKLGTVFTLCTNATPSVFTLYGNQLQSRAAERAVKKFKPKPTIDL